MQRYSLRMGQLSAEWHPAPPVQPRARSSTQPARLTAFSCLGAALPEQVHWTMPAPWRRA